jgi:DNA-binding CsgD family transcriptional regulator
MNRDRVARLTQGQRECLRMVFRHMETKEIARELGISPDGVTQRIKNAMRTLGVSRRKDAAVILAEAEGLTAYPPLVHPPRDIAAAPDPVMLIASTEGVHESGLAGRAMREDQAAFMPYPPAQLRGLQVPLPILGGRPSDLSWTRRLGWIIAIMLVIALVFGMFLAGLESLSRMSHTVGS